MFKAGCECKVWLDDLSFAFNRGFRPAELGEMRCLIAERRAEMVVRWL